MGHRCGCDPRSAANCSVCRNGKDRAGGATAIQAARAGADGQDELARMRWTEVLAAGAAHGYLPLVCDALGALGCLGVRTGDQARACTLLASAQACRDDIRYRFRFDYEQAAVDKAFADLTTASVSRSALTWQAAAQLALGQGLAAGRIASIGDAT